MDFKIDIPFGAKDSELKGWEYTIPEGMEAIIKDRKVIVKEKASEDERIRKSLIEIVERFMADERKEKTLAWLEKQKEHKPNIELIQRSWYMEGYHDRKFGKEPMWIIKTGEGGPKYELNSKYGEYIKKEQKPKCTAYLDLSSNEFEACMLRYLQSAANCKDDAMIMIDTKGYAAQLMEIARKEQKPEEWSEKDKRMMRLTLETLEYISCQSKCEVVSWLKDLSNRFAIQPKQEWSEEDDDTYNRVYCLFRDAIDEWYNRIFSGCYPKITRDKVLSMLKSLRPQLQSVKEKESYKDGFETARRNVARAFMQYLDENRIDGKMCLSNGECEDIEMAFSKGDWNKINRYANKYLPHWKPSEDEERLINTSISFLKGFADKGYENAVECIDWLKSKLNGTSTNDK